LALSEFEFDIAHRDGSKNENADCLSRIPIDSPEPYGEGPKEIDPTTLLLLLHSERDANHIPSQPHVEALNAFFPPSDDEAWKAIEWAVHQHNDTAARTISNKVTAGNEIACRRYHNSSGASDGTFPPRSGTQRSRPYSGRYCKALLPA
jgi:hypothetical protein